MTNLKAGDLIGVVSPSAPITAFCPQRLKRGVSFLESIGYRVLLGKHVNAVTDFTAGTARDRAEDLNEMLSNEEVRAIIFTIGGYNANDILDLVDYGMAKKNNGKIIMGYSDTTVLLYALYLKSGLKCLMGPMILPQFAEFPTIQQFTWKSFEYVINNLDKQVRYNLPVAQLYTEEYLMWDKEDTRERKMEVNQGWQVICEGKAEGRLMPANLNTLCRLIGTRYMPNLNDSVLFLEDDSDENASTLQRMLRHLKQSGNLQKLKGMVFGRFQSASEIDAYKIKQIISNMFNKLNTPVISNVDFGHTDPMLTLPIGKNVEVDTESQRISVIL